MRRNPDRDKTITKIKSVNSKDIVWNKNCNVGVYITNNVENTEIAMAASNALLFKNPTLNA